MVKVGIFSGRFDPPNAGHFMTIERLVEEYHFLLVPILDYSGRLGCTAEEAQRIFEHHFNLIIPKMFSNRLKFVINSEHFAEITGDELHELLRRYGLLHNGMSVTYLAGNKEVLSNIQLLGIHCEYVPRVVIEGIDQYLFESTKVRERMEKENIDVREIYNIDTKT